MIELRDVAIGYGAGRRESWLARGLCGVFPAGRSVALIGRNGAGKSSLLRVMAGSQRPRAGRVLRAGRVSWPVGFSGSFHGDLTGAQNLRFVARVYGVDGDALAGFVADFAELGAAFHRPYRGYSAGMRARLGFALSMGIGFDTYLIDEVTAVGDARFRAKCEAILAERLAGAGAVIVSHSAGQLRRMCDAAAVLEGGRLEFFDSVEAGLAAYERLLEPG